MGCMEASNRAAVEGDHPTELIHSVKRQALVQLLGATLDHGFGGRAFHGTLYYFFNVVAWRDPIRRHPEVANVCKRTWRPKRLRCYKGVAEELKLSHPAG